MSVISDAAVGRGDLMRRLTELEARVDRAQTARRAARTSIGAGGLRVHSGGGILVEGVDGVDVFQVTADPPTIFMRAELISGLVDDIVQELIGSPAGGALIRGLIGKAVHPASSPGSTGFITSSSYGTAGGPEVVDVPISEAGIAVVTVSTHITGTIPLDETQVNGRMSYAVSGATTRSAEDGNSASLQVSLTNQGNTSYSTDSRWTATSVQEGLNEGLHTFTAEYRNPQGSAPNPTFHGRTLVVMGL